MTGKQATHENFSRTDETSAGSERSFGFVFAGFCALVAGFHLWHGNVAFWWWIGVAMLFAFVAVAAPKILRPLNILWFKFGLLLHHIVSPIVLGLMFFAVFAPIGLIMRLAGKRPLNLKFDPAKHSYWIERRPPGPPPGSFNNQF